MVLCYFLVLIYECVQIMKSIQISTQLPTTVTYIKVSLFFSGIGKCFLFMVYKNTEKLEQYNIMWTKLQPIIKYANGVLKIKITISKQRTIKF